MSSELMKKLEKYQKNLEAEIKELKAERKELVEKINEGEALTWKENRSNQKIAKLIKQKQVNLSTILDYKLIYTQCNEAQKKLNEFYKSKIHKDVLITTLIFNIEQVNKKLPINSLDFKGLLDEEIIDLEQTAANLKQEIQDLKNTIEILKKRKRIAFQEEKELKSKEKILEQIEEHLNQKLDNSEIEADFMKIANNTASPDEEKAIIKKYKNVVKKFKKTFEEFINNELDNDKDFKKFSKKDKKTSKKDNKTSKKDNKKSLKERTKAKLASVTEALKNNWKKAAVIGGVIATTAVIVVAANSCSKDNNKSKSNEQSGIEEELKDNKEMIETLEALGIDKITALEYATADGFNFDYINDYQSAKIKYNITAGETVDYVNRAYEIEATKFYDGATIDQIVEVIMSINNKDLFTTDNANLAQSFNTSFNGIVNNYLFGTTTQEDINKLNALPHFAKEGSDMDNFLTEYSTLLKKVISNPEDAKAKDKLYNYVATFALSLNGYTNVDPDIPVSEPYNTNAQVKDYFDWYVAYNSFIAPTIPVMVDDANFEAVEYLQWVMVSALQDPNFKLICGQSRTLGGE